MSLVPTMGAVLIGDFISVMLYGLTTSQVYIYFQRSWTRDPWTLKAFVFYVWLMETSHVFLICAFIFRSVIIEFGNVEALQVTRVSDDVTTAITGLIIFSVHLFYIWRLWILSNRNYLLVGVVFLLAVCHFGDVSLPSSNQSKQSADMMDVLVAFELVVMDLTFKFPLFSQFHKITAYYTGSLALAAANDIIIAVAMTYYLGTRKTGIKSTNTLVNRIITYVITTGALTSVVDLAILICFVTMQNNLVYLSMYNLVNNLYANSLLAMLNAREALNKVSHGSSTVAFTNNYPLSGVRGQTQSHTAMSDESRRGLKEDPITSQLRFTPSDAGETTKAYTTSFYDDV
ncbi:hypothetical protein PUNSTDRAFT_143743 [Punctularia strigosozonata HHB-11173 SS5]|uniref:uncharacterized protein n=1 Tax=Punctularia strigosozonata (strain HHB-11173) TaxID=741275 RepID=UPI0004416257|nr:uncharacterized protein PUNSTDRAFT_143743 [Punctularia strigosozonata HHB-11173 SS5]EIN09174.1 hypothetical protein PUNSTDRAFT_143743 [Punctularia strigosozonata HHB-11173 SS5]